MDELHSYYRTRRESRAGADAPLVLVVEDNTDMNTYIAEMLGPYYQVATAFDGKEGLARALTLRPRAGAALWKRIPPSRRAGA